MNFLHSGWASRFHVGLAVGLLASFASIGTAHGASGQRSTAGSLPAESPVAKQMREALFAAQHGDRPRALAVVEAVLRQRPEYEPAYKLKGMLLEDSGDAAGATLAYRSALKFAPNDSEMLLKVGTSELVAGHIDQAIALLSHRARLVPGDEEGNYYLAQAYHLNGNNDLALTSIRKALKAAPDDAPILQKYGELLCSSGDNAQALQWLKKAQQTDPSLPRIHFDLAVASYNSMDPKAAAEYAAQEATLAPNNSANLVLLASAQIKLGAWQDAKANLQKVLAAKSDDASATFELGRCDLELKDYQAAIDALKHSLQLDPTQVQAHYLLSRAYSAVGEAEQAQHEAALHREMMQHISFTMPSTELRQQAAISERAKELLAGGHEAEALQLFETSAKKAYATRGTAWTSVGGTYFSMGNTQAAERSFQRALALDPHTPGLHAYLGTLALQQADLSEAERNLEAELVLDPNHSLALGELGEVRYRQGRWAEAAALLTRSKTTIPSLLYFLCASDFQLGRTAAANLTAEAVSAYGGNEPAVMGALTDLLKRNGQTELASRLESKP